MRINALLGHAKEIKEHTERLQLPDRRHLHGDKEPPRPGSATATPPLGDNKRRTSTPSAPRRRSHAPANITADQKKKTTTRTHTRAPRRQTGNRATERKDLPSRS